MPSDIDHFALYRSMSEADLLTVLSSAESSPLTLTFAAEVAGERLPSSKVRPLLLALLHHDSAVVREGAIYGLAHCLDEAVIEALDQVATFDSSAAVRVAASGTIEGWAGEVGCDE